MARETASSTLAVWILSLIHIFGDQFVLGQLLLYTLDISAGLIDLIDGNDDLNACGLGMVDGLDGLGHYTIVGCHYQDGNISRVGSTHTHSGKRLMSRCIQEGDLLAVDADQDVYKRQTLYSACPGFTMNSPSIIPIWVVAQGPAKGISEIAVAIADPSIAVNSGLQVGSTDRTRLFRVTSLR